MGSSGGFGWPILDFRFRRELAVKTKFDVVARPGLVGLQPVLSFQREQKRMVTDGLEIVIELRLGLLNREAGRDVFSRERHPQYLVGVLVHENHSAIRRKNAPLTFVVEPPVRMILRDVVLESQ